MVSIGRRLRVTQPKLRSMFVKSCDLTLLDYYLWGVKDKCYSDKPETTDALKDNIREAIGEIQLQTMIMCLKIKPIV